MPDDLAEAHDCAGSHRGADRLVLGEHAVWMRYHHDAAPGNGAGEAHRAGTGGEDRLACVRRQVDAAVSRRVWRRRRLERPDDPKGSDGRPVGPRGHNGPARWKGVRRGIGRSRHQGSRYRRPGRQRCQRGNRSE
jgi:hypothetical protein